MSMYCETQSRTPHHQHRPRTVTTVPTPSAPPSGLPYAATPVAALTTTLLFEPRSARGSFAARVGRQAGVRFAKRSKTFLTSFPFFPPFPSVPILITLSAISEQAHIALAHSQFSRALARLPFGCKPSDFCAKRIPIQSLSCKILPKETHKRADAPLYNGSLAMRSHTKG